MGGEDCGRPAPSGAPAWAAYQPRWQAGPAWRTGAGQRTSAAGPGENRYCSVRSRLWRRVTPRSSTAGLRAAATVDPGGRVPDAVALHERLHHINESAVPTMPEAEPTPQQGRRTWPAQVNVVSPGERGAKRMPNRRPFDLHYAPHSPGGAGRVGAAGPAEPDVVRAPRECIRDRSMQATPTGQGAPTVGRISNGQCRVARVPGDPGDGDACQERRVWERDERLPGSLSGQSASCVNGTATTCTSSS